MFFPRVHQQRCPHDVHTGDCNVVSVNEDNWKAGSSDMVTQMVIIYYICTGKIVRATQQIQCEGEILKLDKNINSNFRCVVTAARPHSILPS